MQITIGFYHFKPKKYFLLTGPAMGHPKNSQNDHQEVSKNNLRLKGNLEVRVAEVAKLKEEMKNVKETMGSDLKRREASLERAKADCRELAEDKAEVESYDYDFHDLDDAVHYHSHLHFPNLASLKYH